MRQGMPPDKHWMKLILLIGVYGPAKAIGSEPGIEPGTGRSAIQGKVARRDTGLDIRIQIKKNSFPKQLDTGIPGVLPIIKNAIYYRVEWVQSAVASLHHDHPQTVHRRDA